MGMKYKIASITTLLLIWITPLIALPAQVVLFRHAETEEEGKNLSLRGLERAAALAPYFQGASKFLQFRLPIVLFAQGVKDASSTLKSIYTLLPLSYAIGVTIHTNFLHDQYMEMAQNIKTNPAFNGKLVIVCWSCDLLADIASVLGVKPKPLPWENSVYDRLWVITYKPKGDIEFQDMPQRLLFGDSAL